VIGSDPGRLREGGPASGPSGAPQGGGTSPPGGGTGPPGEGSLEKVFLENLATIEKAAAHACRNYRLCREEVEDFTQEVKTKICVDDYAVIRKWQGRSSLPTYLVTVVQRALQDYANHLWGKWRPSAEARRLGPLAVDLERLLVRDHYSFGEACQVLRTDHGVKETEGQLAALAAQLPPRSSRRLDSAGGADGGTMGAAGDLGRRASEPRRLGFMAAAETADELVWSHERARRRQLALNALAAALNDLPAEDRLIAKLRAGFSIVEIARLLERDQKRLYKRMERILKELRRSMERAGVSAGDVAEILDHAPESPEDADTYEGAQGPASAQPPGWPQAPRSPQTPGNLRAPESCEAVRPALAGTTGSTAGGPGGGTLTEKRDPGPSQRETAPPGTTGRD
jgi:RNA polymerase sigma factor (sigma-70 family)